MTGNILKRIFFLVLLSGGAFFLSGCGLQPTVPEGYHVSLEIWGVFDDSDAYTKIIADYKKINPYVKTITYRKLAPETYKEDLINALASGKGPDIFMLRNSWRGAFEDKSAPAPDTLLTEKGYRETLVDVAATDFIGSDKKIYGVPTSVDSLALYYNKDLFNAAGIAKVPETWDDVAKAAQKLNAIDQYGVITRSGIALGTGGNVNSSPYILETLMLQHGATLAPANGNSQINFSGEGSQQAFDYYAQFARIGSPLYSWNARAHYSTDAFYEGTLGMMINYSWKLEEAKQKNAKLNIGVVPLPQFNPAAPANVANYWGYAVTKDKPLPPPAVGTKAAAPVDPQKQNYLRTFEAWQFLKYLALAGKNKTVTLVNGLSGTSKEFPLASDPTKLYLDATHKPAARRDLVAVQQNDINLSPFATGNLIAKSWYQGNPEAVDGIFIDMIDSVGRGEKTIQDALTTAANRINLLTRK